MGETGSLHGGMAGLYSKHAAGLRATPSAQAIIPLTLVAFERAQLSTAAASTGKGSHISGKSGQRGLAIGILEVRPQQRGSGQVLRQALHDQ